jgi:(+)-pinoresinol hydroxylase
VKKPAYFAAAVLSCVVLTAPIHAQQPSEGKVVFDKWCAPCHGDGPGKPGTAALQALYKGVKPAML